MLNIYNKENCHYLYGNYYTKSKDDFKLNKISTYYGAPIEYNQDLQDFEQKYKELETKKVNIKNEDVIYFFKESKYPRFKFTSSCDNLKTIQIPKATWLVTPIVPLISNNKKLYLGIECLLTNQVYFSDYQYGSSSKKCHEIYKKATEEDSFVALLLDKFLIQENNYRTVYCKQTHQNIKDIDFFNNVYNNIDKCITEENLEEYITSKNFNELTDELYTSLNTMMQSKDASTVELGIKMLNNFDAKKYALQIGSLLRLNAYNIQYNKALNTVGFKNVMSQLNTDFKRLQNSDTLRYYDSLYAVSDNDEDKIKIQKYVTTEIKNRVNMTYESCVHNITVPTKLTLEVD